MSAGNAHGRRDNGLVAAEYAPAGDVDPRVGEHLLDVLALDGIAAYLRPSTDLHPVTRTTSLPARPTDRLYVDRRHLATAREYLSRLAAEAAPADDAAEPVTAAETSAAAPVRDQTIARTPDGADEPDIERAWAAIIANFDDDPARERTWPDAEDLPAGPALDAGESPTGRRGDEPTDRPRPLFVAAAEDQSSLLDGLDTFGAQLPDDESERFNPPPPPPLPRPALPTVLAVLGVVGGLLLLLRPDLLPMAESSVLFIGFAALVSGFVTLVWRLRPGDEEDDTGPDDGARV